MRIVLILLAGLVLGCRGEQPKLEADESPPPTATSADDDEYEDDEEDDPWADDPYGDEADENPLTPSAVKERLAKEAASREPAGEEKEEEKKRDLNEEFRAAIGDPSPCIQDYEGDKATRLMMYASGQIRPTGRVGQVEVTGAGLSKKALACLVRKGEAIRLAPPDDGEAAFVTATLEVDYEPPRYEAAKAADWDPIQPGQRKPSEPQAPEVPPSGRPIQAAPSRPPPPMNDNWISGPTGTPIQEPTSIPIGQRQRERAEQQERLRQRERQ